MKQNKNQYNETKKIQSNNYQIRTQTHQGKKHLVVPVIMMVEGVHHGSMGPVYHSAEELAHYPDSWNGIPVVVQHPEQDGQNISANRPDVIDDEIVGRVYNSYFDAGKLKAEIWLDEIRIEQVAPEALQYINHKRPLDVSLGMYTDNEIEEGVWNSESYSVVSHNYRPDHLALLPGAQGACSWADGCGVRTNQKGGDNMDIKLTSEQKVMKELAIVNNEAGYQAVARTIQTRLNQQDTDTQLYYMEEVYKKYFVYRVDIQGSDTVFLKQKYTVDKNGVVDFVESPVSVIKKVDYVEKSLTQQNNKGGNSMVDTKVCCPEKVELLLQHKRTPFKEEDREHLLTMEEAFIDKLITAQDEFDAEIAAVIKKAVPVKKDSEVVAQMNKEQAINVLKEQLSDPVQYLALLPVEQREQMQHGLSLFQARKQELIKHITTNAEGVYTAEELAKQDISDLEKLAKLAKAPVDYTILGNGQLPAAKTIEPLLPPGIVAAV